VGRSPYASRVLYWVIKIVVTPVLRVCCRIRVEGKEHVPRSGPVILASNHRSFLDSIFIPLLISRRVTFVAKAEYFDDKRVAWFFRGVGQIPIRREGGSASERALESATAVLEAGGVFGIYPEGTRTRDGKLHRGHTGVARLALRTGAPIIPVGIIGSDEVQSIDTKMPRLFKTVRIRFGEPIELAHYEGRHDDRLALRDVADEVMYEIQQLSGYEYSDTYATRHAEDVPAEIAHVATLAETQAVAS
jgi:1-acyl-sn-glycerol-3-phosphate acyltransferase